MNCQKPPADLDTGFSDTNNPDPSDSGNNNGNNGTNDSGNNNDGGNNTNPTYSGCTDDTQCAGYQSCNVARGRCEDTRKSCATDANACGVGEHCNAGTCTNQCNETTDCAEGLECLDTGNLKLCLTACTDFSATGTDCAPDSHCIPLFGSEGGICKGTGRKQHGENCLTDGDPDGCRPGHACLGLGQQRTCQKLCAGQGTPTCSADTYCEPFFFGPDNNTLTDDAGACLVDCNTDGLPDKNNCPPDYSCISSPDTDKSFCIADDGGGLDAPCDFSSTTATGCAAGLGCLAAGHGATIGETEVGVCTSLCNPTQTPTGCANGYSCIQRGTEHTAQEGVCIKSCDPHKPTANNGCPVGRERCAPETDNAVPPAPGLCVATGNIPHNEACSTNHSMSCTGDDICANVNAMQGREDGKTEGTCTTFCPAFDFTNPSRCPDDQACGILSFAEHYGFCTSNRTNQGTKAADKCDNDPENQGKWCADNILCNIWTGNYLSCEIPCFTDQPNVCPPGQACDSINNTQNPTLGYCR